MKKLLPLMLTLSALAFKVQAQAQEKYSTADFLKHVTKKVTLCGRVASYKIFNDTLTMLNIGAAYPNQTFTVVVTGNEVTFNFDTLKGKYICVTGDKSVYMNKPEILIYHPDQIVFK